MLSSDPAPNIQVGQNGSVPVGGTIGQVLSKSSGVDYDIEWSNASSLSSFQYGLIYELTTSNNSISPNNEIDVSVGFAADDSNTTIIHLSTSITKNLNSSWAFGNNQGGLDTGAKANSTWYHIYLIERSDTGVVDVLFSISPTSPTMPSNYDLKRRIGSIRTDASGNILGYSQFGDDFLLNSTILDVNNTGPGTTASLLSLTVPSGIITTANVEVIIANSTAAGILITSPQQADEVPDTTNKFNVFATASAQVGAQQQRWRTNTSSQIRARATAATVTAFVIRTFGWTDTRNRLG